MGNAKGTGWLERVETQLTLVPGGCTIRGGASCKCTRPYQDKVLVSRDISVVSTAQRQLEDSSRGRNRRSTRQEVELKSVPGGGDEGNDLAGDGQERQEEFHAGMTLRC